MKFQSSDFSPILTVVVCTYNSEIYLKSCLNSIADQKLPNVKLHIIDGGSSDATKNIVNDAGDLIDFFVSEIDNGVYDAMNKAIAGIGDGWVLFLGADDRLLPGVLPRLVNILGQADNMDTLFYGDVYRPSENFLYDGKFSIYKLMRRNICQQAILYPRPAFDRDVFDLSFPINADYILNIKLFLREEVKKIYIPVCVSYYEDISDGISRNRHDDRLLEARRAIALEFGGVVPFIFASAIDFKEWLRNKFLKIFRGLAGI